MRVIILLIATVYLENQGYDISSLAGAGILIYAMGLDLLKNF